MTKPNSDDIDNLHHILFTSPNPWDTSIVNHTLDVYISFDEAYGVSNAACCNEYVAIIHSEPRVDNYDAALDDNPSSQKKLFNVIQDSSYKTHHVTICHALLNGSILRTDFKNDWYSNQVLSFSLFIKYTFNSLAS